MSWFDITPPDPPNDGLMFVDHAKAGRSGSRGDETAKGHLVLYTSRDGIRWDEGRYLRMRDHKLGAYSNNLLITGNMPRLLIQASHAYEKCKTNVLHWWLAQGESIDDDGPA